MASACFRNVGHIRPSLWPRGCYCKHKRTEASVFYAKQSGFLRFCVAVHVPTRPRCPPAVHIGRCTPWAGSHSRQSYCRLQLRSCACSIVPAHRPSHWGEGTHIQTWDAQAVVTAWILREAMLFFKGICGLSFKALFDCISSIGREAQKVNNQF